MPSFFLGPAKGDEVDVAIAFLFASTFDQSMSRDSGPSMGAFLSFEEVFNQGEVPPHQLPTPFDKRLVEVEASFGECLTNSLVSPPEFSSLTPPSFPLVPIQQFMPLLQFCLWGRTWRFTPLGDKELTPLEAVEPRSEETAELISFDVPISLSALGLTPESVPLVISEVTSSPPIFQVVASRTFARFFFSLLLFLFLFFRYI